MNEWWCVMEDVKKDEEVWKRFEEWRDEQHRRAVRKEID